MIRVNVIPGLVVDDELHAAAAGGLAVHAPTLPAISWEEFTDPTRWWLVPSPDDDAASCPLPYKAEFLVIQTAFFTVKVNIWYRPDLRAGETSRPHTHPWEVMEAYPVHGSYEDEHWIRTASGQLVGQGSVINERGSVNRIFARDYHEVTAVADPGRTVSVLVCGRWIHDAHHRGIWGHLDLATGCHVPVQLDEDELARFRTRLSRINPQHAAA
jgi:hypothetical protein